MMENNKPILSIVVPTCNRQECFLIITRIMTKFDYLNFEIVVHDCSDAPLDPVKQEQFTKDSRVKYYYKPKLSMAENWAEALTYVCGEYVVYIGDDDCVFPSIFPVVQFMKDNNIDALVPILRTIYFWPSDDRTGVTETAYNDITTGGMRKFNVKDELDRYLTSSDIYYYPYGLPRTYNGIVSKKILDIAIEKYGKVFGSISPDMFSTIILSRIVKEVHQLDYPIILPGVSPKSGTAIHSKKVLMEGNLVDNNPITNGGQPGYIPTGMVPNIRTDINIWGEARYAALLLMDDKESINKIDVEKYCSILYNQCKSKKIHIFLREYWKDNNIGVKGWLKFTKLRIRDAYFSKNTLRRFKHWIIKIAVNKHNPLKPLMKYFYAKLRKATSHEDVLNIGEAVNIVMKNVIPVDELLKCIETPLKEDVVK